MPEPGIRRGFARTGGQSPVTGPARGNLQTLHLDGTVPVGRVALQGAEVACPVRVAARREASDGGKS